MGILEIGIILFVGTALFAETRKIAGRILEGGPDDGSDDATTGVR